MDEARGPQVFAICPEGAVAPGGARAFSLSRRDPGGEARPFAIFVARGADGQLAGYVNKCPHQGIWLNIGDGLFFDESGTRLRCGRHKALFDIGSGTCVEGPCLGAHLEPVAVLALDGEICLCGVDLVADTLADDDLDETMEITIHPG